MLKDLGIIGLFGAEVRNEKKKREMEDCGERAVKMGAWYRGIKWQTLVVF